MAKQQSHVSHCENEVQPTDDVRRILVKTHALSADQGLSETIVAGELIHFIRPSTKSTNRVIVDWRSQEWLISLSAWRATVPFESGRRNARRKVLLES
jgi:hypothetical protein